MDMVDRVPWTCSDCGQQWLVDAQHYLTIEGDGMAYCPRCAASEEDDQ